MVDYKCDVVLTETERKFGMEVELSCRYRKEKEEEDDEEKRDLGRS